METKGLEGMTREELIDLVGSLNKELEGTKKNLELYKGWRNETEEARALAEKKILAVKALIGVI